VKFNIDLAPLDEAPLIVIARRAVEAQLPKDQPDDISAWAYDVIVHAVTRAVRVQLLRRKALELRKDLYGITPPCYYLVEYLVEATACDEAAAIIEADVKNIVEPRPSWQGEDGG
jgi:hypothetical protein